MRTQDEITARIKKIKKDDLFGFQTNELLVYLDFNHAKEFIKPEITEGLWKETTRDTLSPSDRIKEYMPFAWDKANDCRGLSANRSIDHFISWIWLDGDDTGWLEKEYKEKYEYYGKPQLIKICEKYGIDWQKLDNGHWANNEGEEGITAKEAPGR